MYWDGIIHSFPLCSHLITALDLLVKKTDCLNKTWMKKDLNIVTDLLSQFIKLNDGSVIGALVIYIQESNFPKLISFIDNLPCLDKRPNKSFILQKTKLSRLYIYFNSSYLLNHRILRKHKHKQLAHEALLIDGVLDKLQAL
jgi:hypothetical protein